MYFSFILPVYNVEKYLAFTIESIQKQTFKDFEIILVDDGSKDASPALCDKLSEDYDNIKVLHKKNGGAADSRNAGLSLAEGKYVVFMDSDDFITEESFLADLYSMTQSEPDQVWFKYKKFFDDTQQFGACNFSYKSAMAAKSFASKLQALVSADAFYGMAWIRTIKRAVLTDNNVTFETGLTGEDMDWNYKLMAVTKSIEFIDKPYIAYRQHSGSITQTYKIKNLADYVLIMERWNANVSGIDDIELKYALYGSLAKYYSNLLVIYARLADPKKKEYKSKIKSLKTLLNYSYSGRPKTVKRFMSAIGFDETILLLSILDKIKK